MYIQSIPGVGALVLANPVHEDNRGSVFVPFERGELHNYFSTHDQLGLAVQMDKGIAQQTISTSKAGTARGIHFSPYPKLITCLEGAIADLVVNAVGMAVDGEERGHSVCAGVISLTPQAGVSVFIPAGIGHAFVSLTDSVVSYLSWEEWRADAEVSVNIMTPEVRWHLAGVLQRIEHRSDRDIHAPTFDGMSMDDWKKIIDMRTNND